MLNISINGYGYYTLCKIKFQQTLDIFDITMLKPRPVCYILNTFNHQHP